MKNETKNISAPKGDSSFLHNVKEHAPPLARAHVETGKMVHITNDVDDKAASGGCCVSTCCALQFLRRRRRKEMVATPASIIPEGSGITEYDPEKLIVLIEPNPDISVEPPWPKLKLFRLKTYSFGSEPELPRKVCCAGKPGFTVRLTAPPVDPYTLTISSEPDPNKKME